MSAKAIVAVGVSGDALDRLIAALIAERDRSGAVELTVYRNSDITVGPQR